MSYDILCFSYLRWGGVFQRPQHLLSRLARTHRLFLIEEPEYEDTATPYLEAVPSGQTTFLFSVRAGALHIPSMLVVRSVLYVRLPRRAA